MSGTSREGSPARSQSTTRPRSGEPQRGEPRPRPTLRALKPRFTDGETEARGGEAVPPTTGRGARPLGQPQPRRHLARRSLRSGRYRRGREGSGVRLGFSLGGAAPAPALGSRVGFASRGGGGARSGAGGCSPRQSAPGAERAVGPPGLSLYSRLCPPFFGARTCRQGERSRGAEPAPRPPGAPRRRPAPGPRPRIGAAMDPCSSLFSYV